MTDSAETVEIDARRDLFWAEAVLREQGVDAALQMFAAYLDSGENTVTGRPS